MWLEHPLFQAHCLELPTPQVQNHPGSCCILRLAAPTVPQTLVGIGEQAELRPSPRPGAYSGVHRGQPEGLPGWCGLPGERCRVPGVVRPSAFLGPQCFSAPFGWPSSRSCLPFAVNSSNYSTVVR